MKYFKFNKFNRAFLISFIILIGISALLGHWTGIICGILGICSTFNTAVFNTMYDYKAEESERRRKIVKMLQNYTGIWN